MAQCLHEGSIKNKCSFLSAQAGLGIYSPSCRPRDTLTFPDFGSSRSGDQLLSNVCPSWDLRREGRWRLEQLIYDRCSLVHGPGGLCKPPESLAPPTVMGATTIPFPRRLAQDLQGGSQTQNP